MLSNRSGIIINFVPTGMIPTKEMTPYVPVSVNEIIEDVHRAYEIGITLVHLHARDEVTGEPTYKAAVYGKIIEGIRKFAPDLVVCVSLSGRGVTEVTKRGEPLLLEGNAKPDMGSLTLSSLNFNQVASINAPDTIKQLAQIMMDKGIKPELEVFDVGMINYAKYLSNKKLLTPPYYFNLILGNIASAQGNLLHAGLMLNELPDDSTWSMGGVGDAQYAMNSIAVAMGGGVRVGIEDNIWYDSSRLRLATNFELIKRIHDLLLLQDKTMVSSMELRQKLLLDI